MVRAVPSNASDNIYCTLLAQSAVHGAMAGYTGFTSGLVNGRHTYIPFYVSSSIGRCWSYSSLDLPLNIKLMLIDCLFFFVCVDITENYRETKPCGDN